MKTVDLQTLFIYHNKIGCVMSLFEKSFLEEAIVTDTFSWLNE